MVRYGRNLGLCLVAILGMAFAPRMAAAQEVAIIPHASTLGFGGDIAVLLNRSLTLRVGGNYMKYNFNVTKNGNPYNFHLNLLSGQGMLDWYPFLSAFHVTGGVVIDDNYINAVARTATTYSLNGTVYTAAEAGIMTGRMDFNRAAPYLGIGFGNPVYGSKRVGFTFDAGIAYQGKPGVTLASTGGLLSNDPTFRADLAAEAANLANRVKIYQFYPVVQFGLSFKF
jgi:hypothetical protein